MRQCLGKTSSPYFKSILLLNKNEVPRGWENVFVMTWVRYIGDLLHTLYYKINWAKENRSLYLDLHNIADPLYNDQIFPRNWLQSISYQTGYFVLVFVKHVVRVREHLRTPRLVHFFFQANFTTSHYRIVLQVSQTSRYLRHLLTVQGFTSTKSPSHE